MSKTRLSNAAAKAACDAVVDLIDAGSSNGVLKIYNGTQPAGPDVAVTSQTLLAELALSDPAFGDATDSEPGGEAEANDISDDTSANATGTATWFRVEDSDGNGVIDGEVTATGGGGDLELNSVSISSGSTIEIASWIYKHPES